MDNISLPYKIENVSAHGRVVRLGSVINEILSRHDYPEPVSALLGEAVVLTAIMSSILLFLQIPMAIYLVTIRLN